MSDWMPGVERRHRTGGAMEGQGWRSVVFHTSESGNSDGSIYGVADWVIRQGSEYHLLWNPWTGQFLQLIAAPQSARALKNANSSYRTNRKGTLLVQVCIVGKTADRPLAGGSPLKGWDRLREWLHRDLDIPELDRTDDNRSFDAFQRSGVHRHRDAPGNDHTDPGPIDFTRLYEEEDMPITDDEMNRIADKVVTKLMATPMEDTGYDKGHDMRDTSYRYLLSRIAGRSAKAQQFSKKAADQTVT